VAAHPITSARSRGWHLPRITLSVAISICAFEFGPRTWKWGWRVVVRVDVDRDIRQPLDAWHPTLRVKYIVHEVHYQAGCTRCPIKRPGCSLPLLMRQGVARSRH
jgi:hypothetical protein